VVISKCSVCIISFCIAFCLTSVHLSLLVFIPVIIAVSSAAATFFTSFVFMCEVFSWFAHFLSVVFFLSVDDQHIIDPLPSCAPAVEQTGVVGWRYPPKRVNAVHLLANQSRELSITALLQSDVLTFCWDCSQDRSVIEKGVLTIRHMDKSNTKSCETFICLVPVLDGSADGETATLRRYLGQILEHAKGKSTKHSPTSLLGN